MVNPLRSWLSSGKSVLSLLTNPAYDQLFSARENELRYQHLPWTRRVIDAENFYGGRKHYLIDFLKDEKDSLVLKPAEGYGGRNVLIGRETRDEDWNSAIDRALKTNWLIQECVGAPKMTVPAIVNGKLDFTYKRFSLSAFMCDGKYAGGITRLSDESVINVSKAGGLIPVVVSEETVNR